MPDPLVDEETHNRNLSLCLYGTPGITSTSNRRCDNCPGAARTPQFHQRRCPLDNPHDPNLFSATPQAGKSDGGPKSVASSSSNSAVPKSSGQNSSLDSGTASGVPLRLQNSNPARARSVSEPPVEVTKRKRKADRAESSSRDEDECARTQLWWDRDLHKLVKSLKSLSFEHDNGISSSRKQLDDTSDALDNKEAVIVQDDAHDEPALNERSQQLDNKFEVRDSLRNKVVIFQDQVSHLTVMMSYHNINANPDSSSSLMYEPEIVDEERNES